jgi:7-carboxy-7-deazaguanine synthase
MTGEEILSEVRKHQTKFVCITGGEPLLQAGVISLMETLCDLGYKVSLETSGSLPCGLVDSRVKKIIDVKTPDSGAANSFDPTNLKFANEQTEYKFVICSQNDFAWAEDFSKCNGLFERSNVLYSPAYENIDIKWLAEKILSENSSARLQLQLHKYIWSPHTRGV